MPLDRLTDRIRQRGDRAHVGRDPGQPPRIELQPVEQSGPDIRLGTRVHVARIRLEDLVRARLESVGHGVEGSGASGSVEPRQNARSHPRVSANRSYGLGSGGHGSRVQARYSSTK